MNSARNLFLLAIFFILFNGCHLFESTKVSNSEIKAASTWSEEDQMPSFPECDVIDIDADKKICFETIISNTIRDYLEQNPWQSNEIFDEEINLTLHIDKEGYFSLYKLEHSNVINNAIPNLEQTLQIAVSQLPKAEPAVKTNVGTFVASTIKLPIIILSQ